jgi:hypothetical protein
MGLFNILAFNQYHSWRDISYICIELLNYD